MLGLRGLAVCIRGSNCEANTVCVSTENREAGLLSGLFSGLRSGRLFVDTGDVEVDGDSSKDGCGSREFVVGEDLEKG